MRVPFIYLIGVINIKNGCILKIEKYFQSKKIQVINVLCG